MSKERDDAGGRVYSAQSEIQVYYQIFVFFVVLSACITYLVVGKIVFYEISQFAHIRESEYLLPSLYLW